MGVGQVNREMQFFCRCESSRGMLLSCNMRRLRTILGALLFVVGFLVVPAVHGLDMDHCDSPGPQELHNPGTCAICMVATTALVLACTFIVIAAVPQNASPLNLPEVSVSDMFIFQNHLARAPPAA